jgi:large subunit ribosomal protein L25
MKSLEIVGFKRANLGKTDSKAIRLEANVPAVLYGGANQVHFQVPAFLFRDLVYTPETYIVDLNIEGDKYQAILKDIQFHPVNDSILHADFLLLEEGKKVKLQIPIKLTGTAPGVIKGGKLSQKLQKLTVVALPKDLPDFIELSISNLELGKSVRVRDAAKGNYAILNTPEVPVASVLIPRALKGKQSE